jgi:hypothetical protein
VKIPSTEQDGGINVMSMGRNGFSLAWMTKKETKPLLLFYISQL